MHGLRDAIGDGAVAEQARDQNFLVRQHSHALTFSFLFDRFAAGEAGAARGFTTREIQVFVTARDD
jgi:hypothetical protein